MAQLSKSAVSLRIAGIDLVPDELTRLLGGTPTYSQRKGDELAIGKTGSVRIAKLGMWSLSSSDRKPADLEGQIQEIFGRMTDDLSVWSDITKRFEAELFCGLFMTYFNEGLSISATSLNFLGSRGIELGLDILAVSQSIWPSLRGTT